MHHAGHLRIDRPLERAIDLRRDVVSLRRRADDLELLHVLELRDAGGRVDVVAGQRDVEALAADQLAECHLLRWIRGDRHHAVADDELSDRHAESRRRHLQQHASRFGGDTAHGIAVGLERIRSAGATLIDGDVRVAHDASRLVVRHVELVGHDLAERRARSLTEVRLADEERRGVVLTNHDPRVELPEIDIGIRTGAETLRERQIASHADADDEEARGLDEIAS